MKVPHLFAKTGRKIREHRNLWCASCIGIEGNVERGVLTGEGLIPAMSIISCAKLLYKEQYKSTDYPVGENDTQKE